MSRALVTIALGLGFLVLIRLVVLDDPRNTAPEPDVRPPAAAARS